MKKLFYTLVVLILTTGSNFVSAQSIKILFDARKAEMAGNADWVADANTFNLKPNSSGAMVTGGNEANPQRFPTPSQSGINSSTNENYWKGAVSAWAVACAKQGYTIETLPYNGQITYGNASNVQDLSNYKVYIVDEPNIKYTTSEKTAIIQFVQNGGGLFMISDHDISDRNNDGWDSPHIWNDLMSTNSIATNPFGITFDYQNFSQTTSNINTLPSDPLLHGLFGSPAQMKFSNGTSMTLNTIANSTVTGVVYKTGSSHGTTNVMMAHSNYGSGKVASIGDSSPMDDGTGDTNDQLYNGWGAEVNGDHSKIMMNATLWLVSSTPRLGEQNFTGDNSFSIYPNPVGNEFQVSPTASGQVGFRFPAGEKICIRIINSIGAEVSINYFLADGLTSSFKLQTLNLSNGIYFVNLLSSAGSSSKKIIVNK